MNEQHYVEIKPKRCTECGEDYTPIIHSDECPHDKVGVSEQDELLTMEIVDELIKQAFYPIPPPREFSATVRILVTDTWRRAMYEAKQHYPIMYQEEAEFIGWLLDKGWIPPEEAKQKRLDRPELRENIEGLCDHIEMATVAHSEIKHEGLLFYSEELNLHIDYCKDQILALIPDMEETLTEQRRYFEGKITLAKQVVTNRYLAKIEEAKKQERGRIIFLENNLELIKRDIKARDYESALYRISQSQLEEG